MFKGTFNGTSVANTNIAITQVLNTNQNTDYNATTNVIEIKAPGYYDISVMAQVTATTTGDLTFNVLGNGSILTEMSNKQTIASGDDYTFTSVNTIRVIPSASGVANVSIQFDTAAETINHGLIVVEKRK